MVIIDYFDTSFYIINWGTLNFKTREVIINRIKDISYGDATFDYQRGCCQVTVNNSAECILSISRKLSVLLI